MTITSYQQAVKYLESFIGKIIFKVDEEFLKKHDPLERMRVLLSLFDNPQNKFSSVLVGGTSGKGSTAYLISHILTTAGYKTGFTLSPHLEKVNERLQINGKPISDEAFVKLLKSPILPSIRQMSKMQIGAPSYFEILIGMAFAYFAKEKVDIAVAEVGMGGEYDATNTLNPLVAVLTNVGLDHTNILGETVQKIARTKVGIIKSAEVAHDPAKRDVGFPRLSIIAGVKQTSVIKIIENRCKEVGVKLYRLGKDFDFRIKKESLEGSVFDLISQRDRVKKLNDLTLSLLGEYQIENASLAIEAVLNLKKIGFEVSENAIKTALKTAFFPGRFEVVRFKGSPHPLNDSSEPSGNTKTLNKNSSTSTAALHSNHDYKETVKSSFHGEARPINHKPYANSYKLILDGAHNPVKMKEFLKSLKKIFPKEKKIFIIGFKFDKDIPKMLRQIIKVADKIILTEFNKTTDMAISASAKALNLKSLILNLKSDAKVAVEKDSGKALKRAFEMKPELIVVTGSLYLVGEIRSML